MLFIANIWFLQIVVLPLSLSFSLQVEDDNADEHDSIYLQLSSREVGNIIFSRSYVVNITKLVLQVLHDLQFTFHFVELFSARHRFLSFRLSKICISMTANLGRLTLTVIFHLIERPIRISWLPERCCDNICNCPRVTLTYLYNLPLTQSIWTDSYVCSSKPSQEICRNRKLS